MKFRKKIIFFRKIVTSTYFVLGWVKFCEEKNQTQKPTWSLVKKDMNTH
jgi:hypothetical protein